MSEPNECPRLMEVHRLWEGEIDARRIGEVRQHLAHCSCCRVEYENWERLSELLARGDPAATLVPERQRLMKEQLLAECVASLDAVRLQSAPRSGAWRWRMPVRVAVALAPLALAALLLAYAYHGVPPGEPRSTMVGSPLPAPMSARKPETAPRWPAIARAPDAPKPPVRPRPKVSPRAMKRPHRAVRSRRIELANARLGRRSQLPSTFPRLRVVGRRQGHAGVSSGSSPSALQPIKRIVIQADGSPIRTRSVTHITVIAAGDLEAPGAHLTIVRSRREETLP